MVITGWSRGAIATGAIGLHDDATSRLFKAFVPYSHLDGDCGWVDAGGPASSEPQEALEARWTRLDGRPVLYLGECDVATAEGPAWLAKIGQNGTLFFLCFFFLLSYIFFFFFFLPFCTHFPRFEIVQFGPVFEPTADRGEGGAQFVQ